MLFSDFRTATNALFLAWTIHSVPVFSMESALELRDIYAHTVDRRLELPAAEQAYYATLIQNELQRAGFPQLEAQYLIAVDRSAQVQAVFLYWLSDNGKLEFIGASPASSGTSAGFEYFETPLGIFDHGTANQDFRAEGTKNSKGLRGYGHKGLRVYDFGWVEARRTWRDGTGKMRLQMHSTDPARLEARLGTAQSKGCIRIPASLNELIDRYGILDAGYEQSVLHGQIPWLLRQDRQPTRWSGRYLVIVDSQRATRPVWSPQPTRPQSLPRKTSRPPETKANHIP